MGPPVGGGASASAYNGTERRQTCTTRRLATWDGVELGMCPGFVTIGEPGWPGGEPQRRRGSTTAVRAAPQPGEHYDRGGSALMLRIETHARALGLVAAVAAASFAPMLASAAPTGQDPPAQQVTLTVDRQG